MPSNSPLDKLTPTQRIVVGVVILVIAGIVALVSGRRPQPEPAPNSGEPGQTLANRNVRFGTPAEAKTDPAHKDAYLIERPQYVLSYNDSKKIPNWVCWNLNKNDIGNTSARRASSRTPICPPASSTSSRATTPAPASTAATCARRRTAPTPRKTTTSCST